MPPRMTIPADLEPIRLSVLRALGPIKPIDDSTQAEKRFLFTARRSEASRNLPPYYLLYFLLVDFLGFLNLGQSEKIAWSVPIDFNGQAFLIEHRKLGVGIFVRDLDADAAAAREIAIRLQKAIKASTKYFDWLADQAVAASMVNVVNESRALFARYEYFHFSYTQKLKENVEKEKQLITKFKSPDPRFSYARYFLEHTEEIKWLAEVAIDSFFSWTEHVLIHLAILTGKINTAMQVTELAEADWSIKFKTVFSITDSISKNLFDQLIDLRRELRNYIAHGSFGKNGEAFSFHSNAGAVPLLLPHRAGTRRFRIGNHNVTDFENAFAVIKKFTDFIWNGERKPAEIYIQRACLPCILTMCNDGSYHAAMQSVEAMTEFVDHLEYITDQAANMDW